MSRHPDGSTWFARRGHPRLVRLMIGGFALGLAGGSLWLSADPLGHGLGRIGLRVTLLSVIVVAFAGSGIIAFEAFERGFD